MIQLKRLNAVNLRVRDLNASLAWYGKHFGFERRYDVPGGVLISVEGIELVLSPHDDPDAPLADPGRERCIPLLAFEVEQSDFHKLKSEFASEPDLVQIEQPQFSSIITEDPDGYGVELYIDKR